MPATRWPAVVDALVDLLGAEPGYRLAGQQAEEHLTLVLDGPESDLTADGAPRFVIIGGRFDGDDAGTAGQSAATLGPQHSRDDRGLIVCQAVAQTGSLELPDPSVVAERTTMRTLRAEAFAIIDDLDRLIRAADTLGIVAPRMRAEVESPFDPRQYLTDEGGAVCSVAFSIAYTSRI